MAEPATADITEILDGLGSPEGRADPHPWLHRVRELGPVCRLPTGSFLIVGYRAARDVLADERWLSLGDRAIRTVHEREPGGPDDADLAAPVDPRRVRPVVGSTLSTAGMAIHRDRVANVVREFLDPLASQREVDVYGEIGARLPLTVLADLLGMTGDDRSLLWRSAHAGAAAGPSPMGSDPNETVQALVATFMERLGPLIDARRQDPTGDLLSALVESFQQAGMTEMDLRRFLLMLVISAYETTANLITNSVFALLRHPGELARLREDPGLVTTTIEEVLRWDGSVKAIPRYASVELEVEGTAVPEGGEVAVSLAAANRDPAVFPDPDRFDIGRRPNPHLALAKGVHHCMGAALARIIGQETIGQFVARYPELAASGSEPRYRDHLVVRGLESLHVQLGPAR